MAIQLKDAIKKTLLRTSIYLILGFIYVWMVEHFIDNKLYSSLFIVISILCFFVISGEVIMKGGCDVNACEGGECPYHKTCEHRWDY